MRSLVEEKENAGKEVHASGGPEEPHAVVSESASLAAAGLPEETTGEWKIALLVLVVSVAYLSLFRRYCDMDPDEGIVLEGAQRILRGEVLYRDFFSFYTPGSYYWLASFFTILGSSMLAARTLLAIYGGIFSALTYLLARRVCSRWTSLFAAYAATITCLPSRFLVLHNWDSTLWALLAVYAAVRFVETCRWTWAFGLGSLVALTCLFEQSKGAGLVLGLGLGFLILAVGLRQGPQWKRSSLLALAAGFIWPFLLTFTYFATKHALMQLSAAWLWPLRHYSTSNSVPFGYQNWSDHARQVLFVDSPWGQRLLVVLTVTPCFVYPLLLLLAPGILAYWVYAARRGKLNPQISGYYVIVSAAVSGLLLSVAAVRADIVHILYVAPLLCVELAWVLEGRDLRLQVLAPLRPALNLLLVVAFTALGMCVLLRSIKPKYAVETRRGTVMAPERDTVVEYVQSHVDPGQKILVYPYLPLYYYLTDTYSPTRYEYLQPGMHTPEQYQDALRQIILERPRAVLYELSFAQKIASSWPETPARALANDPVADYFMKYYHPCTMLTSPPGWRFVLLLPIEKPCPGASLSGRGD